MGLCLTRYEVVLHYLVFVARFEEDVGFVDEDNGPECLG